MPATAIANATGKLPQAAAHDDDSLAERLLITSLIFLVSLFGAHASSPPAQLTLPSLRAAVSFPTLTAAFRAVRVPSVLSAEMEERDVTRRRRRGARD